MEQVLNQGCGFIHLLCQEGRGIGLKRSATSKGAAGRPKAAHRVAVAAADRDLPRPEDRSTRPSQGGQPSEPGHDFWPARLRQQSARMAPPWERPYRIHPRTPVLPREEEPCDRVAGATKSLEAPVRAGVAGEALVPAGAQSVAGSRGCDSRHLIIDTLLGSLLQSLEREPQLNLTLELDRLLEVMTGHFRKENEAMDLVGFPQAAAHALRHQAICFATARLRYRFSKKDRVSPGDLNFIRLLWLEHLEVHDAALETFLQTPDER